MTMIERVARALAKSDGAKFEHNPDVYTALARAAIAEMREPTEGMVRTGSCNISPWWSKAMRDSADYANTEKAAKSSWSGMIDAALNEEH